MRVEKEPKTGGGKQNHSNIVQLLSSHSTRVCSAQPLPHLLWSSLTWITISDELSSAFFCDIF